MGAESLPAFPAPHSLRRIPCAAFPAPHSLRAHRPSRRRFRSSQRSYWESLSAPQAVLDMQVDKHPGQRSVAAVSGCWPECFLMCLWPPRWSVRQP